MVTRQLQVERRTGKVRLPESDVLPLSHAVNPHAYVPDLMYVSCDQFIGVETIITVLLDQFTVLRSYKSLVTFVVCVVLCLLGLPLCTQVSRNRLTQPIGLP